MAALVRRGGAHWRHNLALREYLRSSPAARQRYTEAKQVALSSGANTLLPYSAAKAAVVAALLRGALVGNNGGQHPTVSEVLVNDGFLRGEGQLRVRLRSSKSA